jgi:bacteriocin-like protein
MSDLIESHARDLNDTVCELSHNAQDTSDVDGELSENELEAVSGGASTGTAMFWLWSQPGTWFQPRR